MILAYKAQPDPRWPYCQQGSPAMVVSVANMPYGMLVPTKEEMTPAGRPVPTCQLYQLTSQLPAVRVCREAAELGKDQHRRGLAVVSSTESYPPFWAQNCGVFESISAI